MGFTDVTVQAFLGLGSNRGDREGFLDLAFQTLQKQSHVLSIYASSMYETSPWGLQDQPWFLNQVLEIQTTYRPHALLEIVRDIEKESGRQRHEPWGPRTLDIDILLYGNLRMYDQTLVIPHPHLSSRRFVLAPLAEIAPDVWIPGFQKTARELLDLCEDKEKATIYRQTTLNE